MDGPLIVFFILIDFSRLPSEFMSTFVVINFSGNTMISFSGDSIVVAPEEGVGGVRINAVTSKCDDIVYQFDTSAGIFTANEFCSCIPG